MNHVYVYIYTNQRYVIRFIHVSSYIRIFDAQMLAYMVYKDINTYKYITDVMIVRMR